MKFGGTLHGQEEGKKSFFGEEVPVNNVMLRGMFRKQRTFAYLHIQEACIRQCSEAQHFHMSLLIFILRLTIIGDRNRTGIISILFWIDGERGTEMLRVLDLASNRDRARLQHLEITHILHCSDFHYTPLSKPCIISLTWKH